MLKKRGQITVFIILGIVLLIIFGFLYYLKSEGVTKRLGGETITGGFQSMENFISSCVEKSAAEAGFYISEHAGYHYIPDEYVDFYGVKITNAFDYTGSEKVLLLPLNQIEENYARKVEENIVDCVDDFKIFKDMKFNVEYGSPSVTINIQQDFSLVKTNFLVTASAGDTIKDFDEFPNVEVPLRIGRFYDIASYLVNEALLHPEAIHVSYLEKLRTEENINYHVPVIGSSLVYFLIDNTEEVNDYAKIYHNNENYAFTFGEKFG